jgi:hypothetical protein
MFSDIPPIADIAGRHVMVAAASAGGPPRKMTPHQRQEAIQPVKKLTHYSACFDNDWRFRRLAFCTPTSCLQ